MKRMKRIGIVWMMVLIVCCNRQSKYEVDQYISADKRQGELEKFFPYIAKLEHGVNYDNRFDPSKRDYFLEKQKEHKFSFERYYITEDSVRYFLIWKVAPSLYEKKLAIGGRYKKDSNGKITEFEEIFNTPKMKLDELKETSFMLFDYMVENGNVDPYLANYNLVEFPDGRCIYDKEKSRWILTNEERWAPRKQ